MRQLSEKVLLVLRQVLHIYDLAELVDGPEIEILTPQGEELAAEEFLAGEPVRERPVAARVLRARESQLLGKSLGCSR